MSKLKKTQIIEYTKPDRLEQKFRMKCLENQDRSIWILTN